MTRNLGAGIRHSTYGPKGDPGSQYWLDVALQMTGKFPGSHPEVIWIVGELSGRGTQLSFPGSSTDPLVQHTSRDLNEEVLSLFDKAGVKTWLQVEPGFADVDLLLEEMLRRYHEHPCVIGAGVDVEWHRSTNPDEGEGVSDALAAQWLATARSINPAYRLFLKHWLVEKMPTTLREGLFFVDDGQQFTSLDEMLKDFETWAKALDPAPVGFQVGYPADRKWWGIFKDPAAQIGKVLLEKFENSAGIYWVDFTVLDVFPPKE